MLLSPAAPGIASRTIKMLVIAWMGDILMIIFRLAIRRGFRLFIKVRSRET